MNVSIVTPGLLGQGFTTFGLVAPAVTITTLYPVDPRQGSILDPDSDPYDVDPRQGTILDPDNDPYDVDPRQGSILN